MLIEQIDFASGVLNTGATTQALTDVEITTTGKGLKYYRPTTIRVDNQSGKSVSFGLWTTEEYDAWVADPTLSTVMALDTSTTETFNDIIGEIAYVTASGSTGHTGTCSFIFVRE